MRLTKGLVLSALLPALAPSPIRAQQGSEYELRELTIPMRDGVHLFALALVPKNPPGPLPVLMMRTPYSAQNQLRSATLPPALKYLAQDGYVFVVEDIRGRFRSEGTYVMNRAQEDPKSPKGINESTDTYDTIDWLVKNLPNNNGKVGVMGISFPGWLAGVAGVGAHPALKAISPQAPMSDTWLGDDFFHQGAFRQTMGVEFPLVMERSKGFTGFDIADADKYSFYFRFPTLDSLARATGAAGVPSWTDFRTHPAYDAFWQAKALQKVMKRPEVPILWVGGFWDQEDMLGPQVAYDSVERADTKGWNHIALGPWFHGGWGRVGGDSLGPIAFGGSRTGDYYLANIEAPWFAYWLHGKGDGHFPEAWAFEAGENAWHTFDSWPPKAAKPMWLRLESGGRLELTEPERESGRAGERATPAAARTPASSRDPVAARTPASSRDPASASSRSPTPPLPRSAVGAPAHTPDYDAYVSDPAHPIPYAPRPITDEGWRTWLVQDQRFVDNRPDVLTWVTEPLAEDVTIAGDVVAHLFASTTGTDADWVVKLIDVYPANAPGRMGGFELMVNGDILRGRYWQGFTRATPIPANTVTPFTVDLHEQLYRFKKGHRLMVQVQSTWFPLYDRNPQTFVPNIFDAKPADFRAQEHRVWHTARYPSHLVLPVLP